MATNLSSSNLPGKKKWEKPYFVIIDSNQPGDGGHNNNFIEHSAKMVTITS
jgi:hypothetical protein